LMNRELGSKTSQLCQRTGERPRKTQRRRSGNGAFKVPFSRFHYDAPPVTARSSSAYPAEALGSYWRARNDWERELFQRIVTQWVTLAVHTEGKEVLSLCSQSLRFLGLVTAFIRSHGWTSQHYITLLVSCATNAL
jgi:hypothetical protein